MDVKIGIKFTILIFTLVIFSSGCVETQKLLSVVGLNFTPQIVYTTHEELKVVTQAIPSEVYEGKSVTVFFDLSNEGNTTIRNIDVTMTDLRGFTASETTKHIDELEEGETESWSWEFKSPETYIHEPMDLKLRYKVSYTSTSSVIYDVVTMPESEYVRLERENKLNEINVFYYKTSGPVEIDVSLSKEQPLFGGLDVYMYVVLNNKGTGSVYKISSDELVVEYPDTLSFVGSNDFVKVEDGKLKLKRDVEFFNGKTKTLTCKFKVSNVNSRVTKQIKIKANYIYTYYKTINVKVKPK